MTDENADTSDMTDREIPDRVPLLCSPDVILVNGVKRVMEIQLSVLCYESALDARLTGYEALKAALNLLLEAEASLFESGIAIYDNRTRAFRSRSDDPDWPEDAPHPIIERPSVNEFPIEL
jgi:hypothetical protein